jgi:endonuclease-3
MKRTPEETWGIVGPVLLARYKRSKTFLDYKTIFQLLIAVILSAQTTDEAVNKVTAVLFKKYKTPKALAQADIRDVEKIIHSLGYYHTKSRYIIETARMVVENFGGKVPTDEPSLRTLRGVGRKTAVVVLSNTVDPNIGIPVDTHVIRFAKRFDLSRAKNPDTIEKDLKHIIARAEWKRASYAMKEYGRKEGKAAGYKKERDPLIEALEKHAKKSTA